MIDSAARRWSIGDVVAAGQAAYGEPHAFTRDDVKNFVRFDAAGELGTGARGPRGARLFSEEEVVAVVALLPWSAALGGVEGRIAWVARCRQLLRRAPRLDSPLVVEIRPARFGVPRDPTLSPDRTLGEAFASAVHLDLRRIRQQVRVALAAGARSGDRG